MKYSLITWVSKNAFPSSLSKYGSISLPAILLFASFSSLSSLERNEKQTMFRNKKSYLSQNY